MSKSVQPFYPGSADPRLHGNIPGDSGRWIGEVLRLVSLLPDDISAGAIWNDFDLEQIETVVQLIRTIKAAFDDPDYTSEKGRRTKEEDE